EDAVARPLAERPDVRLAIELEGHLLHRRDARDRRQRHAEVALANAIAVGQVERIEVAQLDERRPAPDAEDVEVVAELVVAAGPQEARRLERPRRSAPQPPPSPLADAATEARRVVRLAPALARVDLGQERGEQIPLLLLPRRAPAFAAAIRATHGQPLA